MLRTESIVRRRRTWRQRLRQSRSTIDPVKKTHLFFEFSLVSGPGQSGRTMHFMYKCVLCFAPLNLHSRSSVCSSLMLFCTGLPVASHTCDFFSRCTALARCVSRFLMNAASSQTSRCHFTPRSAPRDMSCDAGSDPPPPSSPVKNASLCECFPYVCHEPVLINDHFLV